MQDVWDIDAVTAKKYLTNKLWRLNNLYCIKNKAGEKVIFKLNKQQKRLLKGLHNRNIILKARQLGITTFFSILFLDHCLFNANISAGIIADKMDSSEEIFKSKIKFALDNLHPLIKALNPDENDNAKELRFSNDSMYRVSTSLRSGTLQLLHISEFGRICRKRPDLAEEIVAGSLNAIHHDQFVTIESTAQGRSGYFYDYCRIAEQKQLQGSPLGKMDFKFWFFPWYESDEYRLDPTNVLVTREDREYFASLEERGIHLDDHQKAFYIKKKEDLGDKIKEEYPSTPDEAFEVSNEGLYYGKWISSIRSKGQITPIAYEELLPVHTAWDLGVEDPTCIWFFQTYGLQIRVIDYYECAGEGLAHYIRVLNQKPYIYGKHYLPHDVRVKELGTGLRRIDTLENLGLKIEIVPGLSKQDGIEVVRSILPNCWFDSVNCSQGIKALESYRREWNEKLGIYNSSDLHDWASHAADAFRMLAIAIKIGSKSSELSQEQIKQINARAIYG